MAPRVSGEIIVISDSDVRLPPNGLSALVGALQPGAGLAYALYRGRPTGNLWSRIAALDINARFAGSAITYVFPLALIGAALLGFSPFALASLIALVVVRTILAVLACLEMGADLSMAWLFPLRDILAFAVFLAAFFGDGIEWRGARLRVKPDGAMASS